MDLIKRNELLWFKVISEFIFFDWHQNFLDSNLFKHDRLRHNIACLVTILPKLFHHSENGEVLLLPKLRRRPINKNHITHAYVK